MDAATAERRGLRARARIVAMATVGSDATLMLTGPMAATRRVLEKAGLMPMSTAAPSPLATPWARLVPAS
jgi:acetyl-CoA acetyltransferase